jgi:hypothetical protein
MILLSVSESASKLKATLVSPIILAMYLSSSGFMLNPTNSSTTLEFGSVSLN